MVSDCNALNLRQSIPRKAGSDRRAGGIVCPRLNALLNPPLTIMRYKGNYTAAMILYGQPGNESDPLYGWPRCPLNDLSIRSRQPIGSTASVSSDLIATVLKVKRNYRLPSESSRTRASDA